MRRFLITTFAGALAISLAFTVHASKRAVTDEGDIVILNANGTWEYENPQSIKSTEILLNKAKFKKGKNATFTLKSKINKSEFSIDPKIWSFKKGDGDAEYTFQLKKGDLYGLAITEGVEVKLENLAEIALQNAQEAAPGAKIVKQEYRIVNGNKVIYLEIVGTMQGINFKYLGYYYSDSSGSTQYMVYTGSNLVNKYKSEIEEFLNGFSIQ